MTFWFWHLIATLAATNKDSMPIRCAKSLLFALAIMGCIETNAQKVAPDSLQIALKHLFEKVDLTRATSGVLLEMGHPMGNPTLLDGTATSLAYVDYKSFELAYATLKTAQIAKAALT